MRIEKVPEMNFRKIVLKLSGEALRGGGKESIDPTILRDFCENISEAVAHGIHMAVVVGGGNIYRGSLGKSQGFDPVYSDYMGMLATGINALAIEQMLNSLGTPCVVRGAIDAQPLMAPYNPQEARYLLSKGTVVIFAMGIGIPFVTTDTAAILRAVELQADAVFKGTMVDGLYSADPKKDPSALWFEKVSFKEVLQRDLRVLDGTAFALAKEQRMPIVIFSLEESPIIDIVSGKGRFSLVVGDESPS